MSDAKTRNGAEESLTLPKRIVSEQIYCSTRVLRKRMKKKLTLTAG